MAVSNVSFMGQTNGSGSFSSTFDTQNALFLKLFAGEVLTAYETATVMKPLHMIRTISKGKTAQFPVTGVAGARYHKPGTDVATESYDMTDSTTTAATKYLTAMKHAERTINIDDLLLASTFVDKLDEMKNHYDVRSIYTAELGRALARQFDKNLLSVACLTGATYGSTNNQILTARAGLIGNPAGTVITDDFGATTTTKGSIPVGKIGAFINAMYTAAAALDSNNVPSEDRYTIVTPGTYYNIINSTEGRTVVNRDFGGGGSYQDAQIATIAGIRIVKSNIAPTVYGNNLGNATTGATEAGPAGVNNTYGANFLRVTGVVFQKNAFGTVKLQDLSMESGYDMRLQGHLMIAKYAMGSSWLRPECCAVLAHNAAVGTV